MTKIAHVAGDVSLADWEPGYLLAELRSGRFTGSLLTLWPSPSRSTPSPRWAGLCLAPDVVVADVDPMTSDLLILPGAEIWDTDGGAVFTDLAARFPGAGKPALMQAAAAHGV